MAKATKHTGASLTAEEWADPSPPVRPVRITRPELGEVDKPREGDSKSHGPRSEQSSESDSTSDEQKKHSDQPPAPATENHSSPTEETDSDALLTDGDIPEMEEAPSVEEAKPTKRQQTRRKTARTRQVNTTDEFDDF